MKKIQYHLKGNKAKKQDGAELGQAGIRLTRAKPDRFARLDIQILVNYI